MRIATLAVVVGLALLAAAVRPMPTRADGPLALAFYYAWFDENSWSPDQVPDFPTPRYASSDRSAIERHVDQARGAGLDGLVQSWWGPDNPTDSNFRTLLDVANATGFKAGVDFELTSPFYGGDRGAITNGLRYLIQTHTGHPAYLRWNGKPVIFFWRQNMPPVGAWQEIRRQLDPERKTLWIAEGTDTSYLAEFDGLHGYSVAWTGDPAPTLVRWANAVRRAGDKIFVATAMPGYDDTRLAGQRGGVFRRDRANGAYYRETFRGAQESGADWVVITSFNEWPEGSYIEPSEAYGDFYLKLTGELVRAWKSGAAAAAPPAAPATGPATANTPGEALRGEAQNHQAIQFNPGAALQQRIFADRFVPNSAEFSLNVGGTRYTAQRAENLATGEVRLYWVRGEDWGAVQWSAPESAPGGLAAEAQRKQAIQFNPGAALQKRIFADGFVPNSPEFTLDVAGTHYTAQRAENLANGVVRVYFVRGNEWGAVQFV